MEHGEQALFICCCAEEAKTTREQAELVRRTISAYALNIVLRIFPFEERFRNGPPSREPHPRPVRPRTGILLRCTVQGANRIRAAAARVQAWLDCGGDRRRDRHSAPLEQSSLSMNNRRQARAVDQIEHTEYVFRREFDGERRRD